MIISSLVLTNVPDIVELGAVLHLDQVGLFTDHSVVTFSLKASVKKQNHLQDQSTTTEEETLKDFDLPSNP